MPGSFALLIATTTLRATATTTSASARPGPSDNPSHFYSLTGKCHLPLRRSGVRPSGRHCGLLLAVCRPCGSYGRMTFARGVLWLCAWVGVAATTGQPSGDAPEVPPQGRLARPPHAPNFSPDNPGNPTQVNFFEWLLWPVVCCCLYGRMTFARRPVNPRDRGS